MSTSNITIEPLNPDVPFNHLPPLHARQTEISRNIILLVLGATIWDILVYISEDIKIIRRSKFHFVVFCFIVSRPLAAGFALCNSIQRVALVNFYATTILAGVTCMLSIVASSYLFLQRVQAVYADTRWVRWLFFVLWVISSGLDLLVPLGNNPIFIPGTRYYAGTTIQSYDSLSVFALLFFDTSVFLAISYKIASVHRSIPRTDQVSWRTLIFGKALPRLSRAVLRGGQQYYLLTVGMTIVAGVTVSLPVVPPIFKPTFPVAMTSLTASMACRVFRNMKLFDLDVEFTAETHITNIPVQV